MERRLNESEQFDTYHVYDDYNQHRYILPPAASDLLTSVDVDWTVDTNPDLDKYAYYYEYNNKGNCTLKKFPGCEPLYLTYDKADRLLLTQDGNQRRGSYWTARFYDCFSRLLYVCEVMNDGDPDIIRGSGKTWYAEEEFSTEPHYYPMGDTGYSYNNYNSHPDARLLSVNYYDDYSFLQLLPPRASSLLSYASKSGYDAQYGNAKGLLTGTRTYRLGSSDYTATAYYYDKKGNVVQKNSTNHLEGCDRHYYAYTFRGKVLKELHEHIITGRTFIYQYYTYTYDHAERLLTTTYKVNDKSFYPTSLTYDDFGRLKSKNIWGREPITYDYNVRGWLTGITSPAFKEKLYYENNGCYNGNIGRIDWKVRGDDMLRSYYYSYDGLDRLSRASYGEGREGSFTLRNGRFDVSVGSYDKQSNILMLLRNGLTLAIYQQGIEDPIPSLSRYGPIDELTFTYDGNRLLSISDEIKKDLSYKDAMEFVDGSDASVEYTYDANGNMVSDKNKGIYQISYNTLNLASRIQKEDITFGPAPSRSGFMIPFWRDVVSTAYDACGTKLQVRYETESGKTIMNGGYPSGSLSVSLKNKVDYCENIVYENDTLRRILMPEGYVIPAKIASIRFYMPYFYLRDHQGNVRCVLNGDSILQTNHYYPFGGLFGYSIGGGLQRYKYGGKELERMHGLDLYDFSARSQDPMSGRFLSIDPLCEKYYFISPYAYCLNNPVKYVDPSGMFISTHTDEFGKVIDVFNDGDLGVYMHRGFGDSAREQIESKYSLFNTSAGGIKMGETFVWNSFVDADYGTPQGKIKFNSWEANRKVFGAVHSLAKNNSGAALLVDYALNASNNETYDLKSTTNDPYNGSLFEKGKYVSMRDAGNILAGMAAKMGGLPAKATYTLFGAFELSQNSRKDMYKYIYDAYNLGERGYYGEKPVSHFFQKFGYEFKY